ncbi:hypothetical protein J2S00_003244 [Caldalkalibacillus uzonensis]|uniref:DUF8052 domain-containing protein n=1 Tax=Caldalkalibacillus uzonensis TaxID=353224 RepID=A0ABU0CX19_9BACI|nr:hypothetical protein [Caldalkalibacillus uzonensis]MDQ0340429.1 hypothetical protein [Caldalkalibacillus uzonensis]
MSVNEQTIRHYIQKIANRFVHFFDVYRDEDLGQIPLAFMALYKRRDERYLITKSIKVWGVENQQCVFVAASKAPLTSGFIQMFKEELIKNIKHYVPEHREHMSTIFLGVMVTDQPVTRDLVREVRRFRKLRFIKYGWYGWAEIYMAIVDLKAKEVHIHPKGESFVEPFKKQLTEEA